MSTPTLGSVHGRFQPLHNGHLEYIEATIKRCDYLYVGITQFEIRRLVQVDSAAAVHRGEPGSNPLTYFERTRMVHAVMHAIGQCRADYEVIPFPIEDPERLPDFLPTHVPIYTTTYDEWNRSKIEILQERGYDVKNLWTRPAKTVTGHSVRERIRRRDSTWKDDVPREAAELIEGLDLAGRLASLDPTSGKPK